MIIISNGFSKFHLAIAAAEAERRGFLVAFMTGAYPFKKFLKFLDFLRLNRIAKVDRLIARRELINEQYVYSDWISESVYFVSTCFKRIWFLKNIGNFLNRLSMRLYGWRAIKGVRNGSRLGGRIYHYRAGFGHGSVKQAKKLGMVTLCDHSIVHPNVLEHLVDEEGYLPRERKDLNPKSQLWKDILVDINQADHVLVNSDFVKKTFLDQGWDEKKVHVVYLGVDDNFLEAIPKIYKNIESHGPLRLMFAGAFERRKGAEILISALETIDDLPWRLEIAGPVNSEIKKKNKIFFQDSRVILLGNLSRNELAKKMAYAEIFIFPSFAEGSARVVFEALACGCYVITTPNSGSILEDGVHGALVPPGNAQALAESIRQAYAQRAKILIIGRQNIEIVRARYRQCHYGDRLAVLYQKLWL